MAAGSPEEHNKLREFQSLVDAKLASILNDNLKAEVFNDLLMTLMEEVSDAAGMNAGEEGFNYLASKAKEHMPSSVLDLITASASLRGDNEVILALAINGLSQSINGIALDVIRRQVHGSDRGDFFADAMNRLKDNLIKKLELRGVMLEMGIDIPDMTNVDVHWTYSLFEKVSTVAEYRNIDWNVIKETLDAKDVLTQDKSKMEQLYTGKLGPQNDVEYIPRIREELRAENIDLTVASHLEKKNFHALKHVTKSDIDEFKLPGKASERNEQNKVKSKLKSVLSTAQGQGNQGSAAATEGDKMKNKMSDKEAFEIGQKIKGGSDTLKGLDDLADVAPLIASVTGVAAPQVALAIAATKIFAQEMQNRQKEADEIMTENKERAQEARDESLKLMDSLSLKFAKEGMDAMKNDMDLLRSKVEASAAFSKVGDSFDSEALLRNLTDNATKLPSSRGGVIESYKTDEDLVASVSGGMALHGISLLLGNDFPIELASTPILKQPAYVEVLGVTDPFQTSTLKFTKESELATFRKTATSGGMSMATSISSSNSRSTSSKFWGVSTESTSGSSTAHQLAESKRQEEEESAETNTKIKSAFLTEYISMPMRCVRIPYDAMRLSEEAKRMILKIVTKREALHFLRTFGSHLSCGEHTLGGVFFRTIAMQSTQAVSSVSMYSAAGMTLSYETSTASTKTNSAGVSVGLFGLGPKVGTSSTSQSAMKSGGSTFESNSFGEGKSEASGEYSYSISVSSLGPNASTPEEFYSSLNENTGTWSVIDKGEIQYTIPVWDLIRDEYSIDSAESEDIAKQDEKVQIARACRLMKRVWATQTKEYLELPSSLNLPKFILNGINDFVSVDQAIGEMVKCICTVIKPNLKPVKKTLQGNRLAMLKSLEQIVRKAKDAYLESKGEFPYDNWFLKDFLDAGNSRITQEVREKLDFPDFDVVPLIEDDNNQHRVPYLVKMMHARAAESAQELSKDAWEDLCDEFVSIARIVYLPYFRSAEDDQRIAKVWNVANLDGASNPAYMRSATGRMVINPLRCIDIHCPDVVTSVQVTTIPPLAYKSDWRWFDIIKANRIMTRTLYPGTTYYWIRDETDDRYSTYLVTEDALLSRGSVVLENENACDVLIKHNKSKITIPKKSVYVLKSISTTDNTDPFIIIGKPGNTYDQDDKWNDKESDHKKISAGQKYFIHYRSDDPLMVGFPTLLQSSNKVLEEKRNKGSLLVSYHAKRRMHTWQGSNAPLNAINSEFKNYCSDQFWDFVPVDPPDATGEMFDPDQQCFLIVSKKTRSRLFADTLLYDGHRSDFGLVPNGEDVEDSQKWQVSMQEDSSYHIVNASSDRFLGLEDDDGENSNTAQNELNRIIAGSPEEFSTSSVRFQWSIVPWQTVKASAADWLPKRNLILSQQTLPADNVLGDGGIVIHNDYPQYFSVLWKEFPNFTRYNLMANSHVFVPFPKSNSGDDEVLSPPETSEIVLQAEHSSTNAYIKVFNGQKHFIYFPDNDPLCLDKPQVLTVEAREEAVKNDKGLLLIHVPHGSDKESQILGGIEKVKEIATIPISVGKYNDSQIWKLESTESKNQFRIFTSKSGSGSSKSYITVSDNGDVVLAELNPINPVSSLWTFSKSKYSSISLPLCSVRSNYTKGYLTTEAFQCTQTKNFAGQYWAIIPQNDINNKATKTLIANSDGTPSANLTYSTKALPNPFLYRESKAWRLVGNELTNSPTTWDVSNIQFLDPFGRKINVNPDNAISSGHHPSLKFHPNRAFEGGMWGGRKDGNAEVFFVGMHFKQATRIKTVQYEQSNAGHNANIVRVQCMHKDKWRTVAVKGDVGKATAVEIICGKTFINDTIFLVVTQSKVVFHSVDLEKCKGYLMKNFKGQTPQRMICEVNYGKVNGDPHTVGGQNQGGGIAAGFNKFWWDWNHIRKMNGIAQSYINNNPTLT